MTSLHLAPPPARFGNDPISIEGLEPGDALATLYNHMSVVEKWTEGRWEEWIRGVTEAINWSAK